MTNIFLLISITISTLLLSSCATVKKEYLISKIPHIQELEKQDHKFCASVDLEQNDNYTSSLYWRCRLSMAKYKILPHPVSKKEIKYNIEINELIAAIAAKVADTPESSLLRQDRKLDDRHHKKCLAMGFDFNTNDSMKSEDYFACRKALIDEQRVIPPFGNVDYLKYQNNSYNLGFVIGVRVEKALQRYKEAEEKYPTCIKYYNNDVSFKKCLDALEASKRCFSEIEQKKYKKELEQKISCQKRSYLQFPEELLIQNKKDDLERKNDDSNYYNKQNLAAIGLTIDKFDSDSKRIEARNKEKKNKKDINSRTALYSKFELTKLRGDYIAECQKEIDDEVKDYAEFLNKECGKME